LAANHKGLWLEELTAHPLSLITALSAADNMSSPEIFALQILGLPGRGLVHQYLYRLLQKLENAESMGDDEAEALAMVRAFLEPIRAAIGRHEDMFRNVGLLNHLDLAFQDFDKIFEKVVNRGSKGTVALKEGFIPELVQRFQRLFKTEVAGLPNVRRVLSREYVHYLPYFTRQCLEALRGQEIGEGVCLDSNDFLVEYPLTPEERQLFDSFRPAIEEREVLVERLQQYPVAIVARSILQQLISDMLVDVKHPKMAGAQINYSDNVGFMKVTFSLDGELLGQPAVSISFENASSKKEFESSHGNTWSVTSIVMQKIGGRAYDEYENGCLRRTLIFPAMRQRRGA
jgi:hypothetical protein